MTGRDRILKTLKGERVDRVPIWLGRAFANDGCFNDFTEQFKSRDKRFIELKSYYYGRCEIFRQYSLPRCSRILVTPPEYIHLTEKNHSKDRIDMHFEINTPKGRLTYIDQERKNISTSWRLEYPVKNRRDIEKLLAIDFEVPSLVFDDYYELERELGDRGVIVIRVESPMVAVSSTMPFQDFLMYIATDFDMIKDLTEFAFIRIKQLLQQALEKGIGPIFRIMGCEQATPPMNSPEIYDELVYPYEKRLIEMIHKAGMYASVHCHGRVRALLPKLIEMEVDMLDPVEAPPSGDIDFLEAKRLVNGKMTLAGNIQFDDMERKSQSEIARQIKNLFADGRKDHVIINITSSPITSIGEKMFLNYKTLIEEGIRRGTFSDGGS